MSEVQRSSDMFTKEEAVSFLQNVWGMKNVEGRFRDDRKGLLEEIIILAHAKLPFQNITIMATEPKHRQRPSVSTIKEGCMSGIGGVCYNINVFVWSLLKALGFSAWLCPAFITGTAAVNFENHVVLLISDLNKKDDLHTVECACMFPTFRVISLNFEDESPVFMDSFLEYKYIRHEGWILRMHGNGDTFKHNDPPIKDLDFIMGKWRRFYYFSPSSMYTLSDLDDIFDRVFPDPSLTPLHKYFTATVFPAQKTVSLVNYHLIVETANGQMETSTLDGDEAIVDCCRQYFPTLPENIVRRALHHWHERGSSQL